MVKDLLEQYYNDVFKQESDPDYKDLTNDQLKTLRRSLSFASYHLKMANVHFVKAIASCYSKISLVTKNNL